MNAFSKPEYERTVLASLLEYPETLAQAIARGLREEHFCDPANRALFAAISGLEATGRPVGYDTVISTLRTQPEAKKLVMALDQVTEPGCLPRKDLDWHIDELRKIRQRALLTTKFKRVITIAEDPKETTQAVFEYAYEALLTSEDTSRPMQVAHPKEFMPCVLKNLEECAKSSGLIGLGTGIRELDEATTGIRPGELWVIGALTGRGKTALATQIACANASAGTSVAMFSLEMSKDELGCRLLSNTSTVSASYIRNPNLLRKEQWQTLISSADSIVHWPLYVDTTENLSLNVLLARARLYIRRYGCRLIVVDYIRMIDAPGREIREQVANVTNGLRQLAKSERVGVVALSQLSRPKDGKISTRPTMLNLKESGDIEAHAHVVLVIYMPAKNGEPTGKDEIIISKNRHGPIGTIKVEFNRNRLQFMSRTATSSEAEPEDQSSSVAEQPHLQGM